VLLWSLDSFLVSSSITKLKIRTMARKNIKKATKKTVKAKQNSVASSKTARALRARHLQSICAEIDSRRSSNGRVPEVK